MINANVRTNVRIKEKHLNPKVTLKDVAQHAGVSYQTVSKVLNSQIQVTPETRARIEAAVKHLGYRPNTAARSLRTQATYLIGYSFKPNVHNKPYSILEIFLQSIVRTAQAYGYHIMLFPWQDDENIAHPYQELITANRVDGFILSDVGFDDPRILLLQNQKFPFVAFGRSSSQPDYAYVDVDGRAGIRLVVEHFVASGHQKIAILAWPEFSRVGAARLNGYYEAMQDAGLSVDPAWVRRGEGTLEAAYANTLSLLDLPAERRPTAIVTLVDSMALGAVHAIQERGYLVGQEIGVTGFDDTPLSQHVRPSLTTLRQPVEQVGTLSVELLMNILSADQPAQSQFLLSPELIIRESSLRQSEPSPVP